MLAEDRYDSLINYYAEQYGVDPQLIKEQMRFESAFDPDALSGKGARGLSQFMQRTWEEWRDGTPGIQPPPADVVLLDPRDSEDAIRAQSAFMGWLFNALGDLRQALAAYNWGIGNLRKALKAWGTDWFEHVPEETRDYVNNICAALSN